MLTETETGRALTAEQPFSFLDHEVGYSFAL
jgi:hypothetical protein